MTLILTHIPLDQLKVSPLNMRHGRKVPDISDLLPSIRAGGLRQPLLVRKEGRHYGVVAGRRRLFALRRLAKESGETAPDIPCAVMEDGDDAAAIEASLIENVARLPAGEMQQYEAYLRLHAHGRSVDEIAGHFGVTELMVRRVLALASLIEPVRKLYAKNEITADTARALTLATPEQQAEWLVLFEDEDQRAPQGRQLRAWLTGGAATTTDKALFDLDSYQGQIVADLFGDHGVFASSDEFWRAQSEAIALRVEELQGAGWADVVVLDRGEYFTRWDMVEMPRETGGKVFVECRHDGTVTFFEGWLSQADARKRERALRDDGAPEPAEIKPEMSGPMFEYLALHRHGAARARLLDHPAIALRLMVAHALAGSCLWQVRPFELRTRKETTEESIRTSRAEIRLSEAQDRTAKLLAEAGYAHRSRYGPDPRELCEIFDALLKLDDQAVLSVLAFVMADTLEPGGPVVEALLSVLGVDIADWWRPDEAFFDLLRDKRAINQMVADIASPTTAKASLTDKAATQKEIIRNRIRGNGCDPSPRWVPGWMAVPPRRLVPEAESPIVEAWAAIADLFATPDVAAPEPHKTPEPASA